MTVAHICRFCLIFLVVLLSNPVLFSEAQSDILYDYCNVEDYYADLLRPGTLNLREDITRQELEKLLESTHRNVLPYTNNNRDDVWKALIDLDSGRDPDMVQLIYSQQDVPVRPHGTTETWNREHLWPKSRGVEDSGADFTDIHHLRPGDWNVNSARGNLYFGECGTAETLAKCNSPAHGEASTDTASDSTIFRPPQSVQGDVARAILYMDVRYSNQNNNGKGLTVTDCPTDQPNEMAYRSDLLRWHTLDPVTNTERQRNQRACERWQGNRNPFVDFPDLVEKLFGKPQLPVGEGLGYPCDSTYPVPSSDPSATMRQCKDLTAGDVMIIGMNSDNPDLVALAALEHLEEGLVLYLTDNAWTGSSFGTNEGTISIQVPPPGISAGTVFGYGVYHGDWENVQGQFQLSAQGDNILLYCQEYAGKIQFLSGLDNSGLGWIASLSPDADDSSRSSLPDQLIDNGGVSLPHFDNYLYKGATSGSVSELQTLLSDPNQWEGSNDVTALPSLPTSFSLSSTSSRPAPGDVMVVAMNSDNPDMVALVALENLPGNLPLYMTDNAWTGNVFRTNEGTLKLTLPSTGVEAGTVFGYGANLLFGNDWEAVGGQFALSESGDSIFLYTKDENDPIIQHVAAFCFNGGWKDAGLPEDSYGSSALPESLRSVGAISLPHKNNYAYIGGIRGDKAVLQVELQNETNWRGSDTDRVTTPTARFSVSSSSGRRSLGSSSSWFFQTLALSLVKIGV